MPIANCVITLECARGNGSLIELWSSNSGISAEHMTVNIITSSEQLGHKYKVMANLALPSIWSASEVSLLQLGLANALSSYFSVALYEVHVITNIITSGRVVEAGQELKW